MGVFVLQQYKCLKIKFKTFTEVHRCDFEPSEFLFNIIV